MINLLAKDIEGGVAGGPVAVQAQYLVLIPPIYDDDDDDGDIDDDCGDNGDIDYEDHYGRYIFSWPPVKYSLKEIFFLTYLNLNSVLHDDDDDDDDEDLLDGQASFQVSSWTIEASPPSNSLTVFRNLKSWYIKKNNKRKIYILKPIYVLQPQLNLRQWANISFSFFLINMSWGWRGTKMPDV